MENVCGPGKLQLRHCRSSSTGTAQRQEGVTFQPQASPHHEPNLQPRFKPFHRRLPDRVRSGQRLYTPVVQLGATDAQRAFSSLSGEAHASLKSAAVEDSRFVRDASLGRLREAFDTPAVTATDGAAASGPGVWAQVLGLRGSSSAGMPGGQARLRGLVGWRHAFGDGAPTSTLALAGQSGFAVAGVPIAKNALVLEGGIDFAVGRNLTVGVSYVGQAASQLSDHGVKASLLWKF